MMPIIENQRKNKLLLIIKGETWIIKIFLPEHYEVKIIIMHQDYIGVTKSIDF
jgi:hypothetical protein